MINCRRPSNRSSRLALPLGPSNSYGFSTASHGIRRRSAASASRARVNSFSFTRSAWRAASHSFSETTFGLFISDVKVCVLIFSFRSLIVQRTNTPVLDAYFACPTRGARLRIYYDRLFRGVAAAKSLSRRGRLHRRRGVLDSNSLGRVSSLGVAKLEFAPRHCGIVNRVSDRAHSGMDIRSHRAGDPGDTTNYGRTSTPQSHFTHRCGRDCVRWWWIFSFAANNCP